MPAQKRQLETTTTTPPPQLEEENGDYNDDDLDSEENQLEDADEDEEEEEASDSEDSSSYSSGGEDNNNNDEFIVVKLADIRKEVQCPICLGIIRKTRTVMECLHRFCRACIDKSMRLGNNECPACRTHCASRRSLRDDPNYDAMISALYPDIDKYEEEELAFHEEEKARNKQIQASIAQTSRRQAEALGKKKPSAKAAAGASGRGQNTYRNLRGRKSHRVIEHHESDEEEGANGHNGSRDSSSDDDHSPEVKVKRSKRGRPSKAKADVGCDDNDSESNRELLQGVFGGKEILAWGKGGMRSNNRHGGLSWTNGKISKSNRLSKLIDHLRCSNEDNELLKISLTLVSLHENVIPCLKRPFIRCSATSSVRHLCQYVSMQTSIEASGIEMVMMKDFHPEENNPIYKSGVLNFGQYELLLLDEHQTLKEIHERYIQQNLDTDKRLKVKKTDENVCSLSLQKGVQR